MKPVRLITASLTTQHNPIEDRKMPNTKIKPPVEETKPKAPRRGESAKIAQVNPQAITSTTPAAPIGDWAFKAQDFAPMDLFEPTDKIPAIDEATAATRIQTVQGQQRSVAVATENLKLIGGLLKAEGVSIDNSILGVKNQGKATDLQSEGVRLQQSQAKLAIEGHKLTALGHDVAGYEAEAAIKGQVWTTKLDSLKTSLAAAQAKLAADKQALQAQIGQLAGQ
jgi:hypothetical protein